MEYGDLYRRANHAAYQRRRPVQATLCLTHRCNLRCVHCYLTECRETMELDGAWWKSLLDQASDLGCLWVTLTGGEPLLHPDFAAIYEHAKSRGMLVSVATNATLIDDSLLELFTRLPPHHLDVSLYGLSAATYNSITGTGHAGVVQATIKHLTAREVRVVVKSVVLRQNDHEVQRMQAWADDLGLLCRFDGDIWPTLSGSPSVQRHRVSSARRAAISAERAAQRSGGHKQLTPAARDKRFICSAGRASFHVSPAGKLSLCLMDRAVADLQQTPLLEAIVGPLAERSDTPLPLGHPCRGCELREHCAACPPLLRLEGGTEDACVAVRCAAARDHATAYGQPPLPVMETS